MTLTFLLVGEGRELALSSARCFPPASHSYLIVDEGVYFLFFIAVAIKDKYCTEPQSEYNERRVESSGPGRSHYACVRPKV